MIAKLKQFLQSHTQATTPEDQARQLNLAAASLLLEVMYADETLDEQEVAMLPAMLTKNLGLTLQAADELIAEAKLIQGNATSLYEFTAEINAQCSIAQKQKLLLGMWKLAYSDGKLCRNEDQIIRRTADLLHLKHSEVIQMRNIAMEQR
ncbi:MULTISPECIES: TerB family tellurite resistance protein [unclassified Shewanella]|uniref:tellurite resistance TerB family protein n=1 Tax=unclassified Shewanella TaxID=196818 RepID=UPI000C865741|nr:MULTISPECIES: TerB family tellurite resistance protein [unclassified Shewanella]MDO6618421.1 TerB family tellurite resistance protein [Shewanella sp. 6_MG-2023]MDO6640243.1 TerB family tellurite resistance protein [Shewanella sp. 5_MG-2023]MDO6679678.1 TerB family tellurite resistance protein [Shewanella sp. 4_MG-2023]MDO6774445.1 TerB family tellurite resistance protein [Shewanella sp. 3_MG-2023]PMG28915.1 tellurium resistance terB-like protein subgroup 2 [Shewanella sp. 10N.286.52.C2]